MGACLVRFGHPIAAARGEAGAVLVQAAPTRRIEWTERISSKTKLQHVDA